MEFSSGAISKEKKSLKPKKIKQRPKSKPLTLYSYHARDEFMLIFGLLRDRYKARNKNAHIDYSNHRCKKFINLFYRYENVMRLFENRYYKINYLKPLLLYHNNATEKNFVFEKRRFEKDTSKKFEDKPKKNKHSFGDTESCLWEIILGMN